MQILSLQLCRAAVQQSRDLPEVAENRLAHRYFTMMGLSAELVFIAGQTARQRAPKNETPNYRPLRQGTGNPG